MVSGLSYSYSVKRYSYSKAAHVTGPVFDHEQNRSRKSDLKRIVSLLTQLIQWPACVSEGYIEYEYEYRDAENEYEGMQNSLCAKSPRTRSGIPIAGYRYTTRRL